MTITRVFRLLAVTAISSFAVLTLSGFFFFFLPLGWLLPNDKKAVDEFEQKQDWAGLLRLAETRVKSDDTSSGWHYLNGYALVKLSRCPDALPQFRRAVELKSENVDAENYIGVCQNAGGDYDAAIQTFTSVIGKKPDYWQAYNNMVLAYVMKEDATNARIYLEQLKPRNIVAASAMETSRIAPLEARLAAERVAKSQREVAERERAEADRKEKQEAVAKAQEESKAQEDAKQVADARASAAEQMTIANSAKPKEVRLKELKSLYAKGLVTKEIYESTQREILRSPLP